MVLAATGRATPPPLSEGLLLTGIAVVVVAEVLYPLAMVGIVTHRVSWAVPLANLGARTCGRNSHLTRPGEVNVLEDGAFAGSFQRRSR